MTEHVISSITYEDDKYLLKNAVLMSKTFENIIATANDINNATFYFGKIIPKAWNIPLKIRYRVKAYCPSNMNYNQYADVSYFIIRDAATYALENIIYSTSYRSAYYHNLYRAKEAGISKYGHLLGESIYSSTNPTDTNYKRTFEFEILELENCTFEFFDTPVLYANAPGTGSTNYTGRTDYNFTGNGLYPDGNTVTQTRIDSRLVADTNGVKQYSIMYETKDGKVESLTSGSGTGTTKAWNTNAKIPYPPRLYYYAGSSNVASGSNIATGATFLNISTIDMRYSDNITSAVGYTINKPLYLECSFDTNGFITIGENPYKQTFTKGKYYIFLGWVHTTVYQLSLINGHAVYYYDGTNLISYDKYTYATKDHSHDDATTSTSGFISSTDKTKLDGIAEGATKTEASTTNGKIKINGTDTTVYTHPSYTAKSSGFYKVTVDSTGHVSGATAVAKSDITALGIPGSDTTYSAGTGLSLSGTTFNHSNSITAVTTAAFKKFKYDAQGHITGTADVAASDLPAHDHAVFTGATSSTAGAKGMVPAPSSGSIYSFLRSNGTWGYVPNSSITDGEGNYVSFRSGEAIYNEYLSPNRFAGMKAAGVTIEYSIDGGTTWVDYGASDQVKQNIFTNRSSSVRVGGPSSVGICTDKSMLRIIIDTTNGSVYTTVRKLMIYMTSNGSYDNRVTIDAAYGNDVTNYSVKIVENMEIQGWSDWNTINKTFTTYGNAGSWQVRKIRFTFSQAGLTETYAGKSGYGLLINSIFAYGGVAWVAPSNMALNGHAYSYDGSMNVTFPAKVTATNFVGNVNSINITGTANTTYNLNDFSKTDTTYSAGTGLSLSGTTFNHSNSITAVTTAVFKKFTYDAQGHITGSSAVAASDLPAHTHSYIAGHSQGTRLTSANLPTSTNGNGAIFGFVATSTMTEGKPPAVNGVSDAHILQMNWDNNGGYDSQIAVYDVKNTFGFRSQSAGTWGNWAVIYADTSTGNKTYNLDTLAGKSTVSISRNLTSGTKIGTITIDGTETDLYCQTNTNTDTKVTQTATTTDANYEVLFSETADNTTRTEAARKNSNFKFNPNYNRLSFGAWEIPNITGSTTDLNSYNDGNGYYNYRRVRCTTTGGGNNISNKPADSPFVLEIILIRWASATDYITKQIYHCYNKKTYQRFCTNGTWSDWTEVKYTDTTYDAEKGISLTSGKFGHSNTAITASTTAVFKKIAYDAYGHITSTSNVTASDLPDHTHNYVPNTNAGVNAAINLLTTGTDVPKDGDYYISQYANGGTSHTDYYRRPVSKLWDLFKTKISATNSGTGSVVTGVTQSNGAFTITLGEPTVTVTDPTSLSSYGVLFAADPNTTERNTLRKNNNFKFKNLLGTTSTEGRTELILGNSTAKGTANNETGILSLYGDSTHWVALLPASEMTGDQTIRLPDKSGTIALTSDINDTLVKQTVDTSSTTASPILVRANPSSGSATAGEAKYVSNVNVKASTGTLTATEYSVNSKVTMKYDTSIDAVKFVFA